MCTALCVHRRRLVVSQVPSKGKLREANRLTSQNQLIKLDKVTLARITFAEYPNWQLLRPSSVRKTVLAQSP